MEALAVVRLDLPDAMFQACVRGMRCILLSIPSSALTKPHHVGGLDQLRNYSNSILEPGSVREGVGCVGRLFLSLPVLPDPGFASLEAMQFQCVHIRLHSPSPHIPRAHS